MSEALALRRAEAISGLAEGWARTAPADAAWYRESVASWLAAIATSPHTRRSYTTTVAGFFAWAAESGRNPLPHRITEADVEAWVAFQQAGGRTLPAVSKEDRAALDACSSGPVTAEAVAAALDRHRILGGLLNRTTPREAREVLGRLAKRHLVQRLEGTPPRWSLPRPRGRELSPATMAQRLAALESFFRSIIGQGGERAGQAEKGPMRVSPASRVMHRFVAAARGRRRAVSARRRTRAEDWEAIRTACWERDRADGWKQRDWTIVVCLATMGLRVAELCRLRLRDIESVPDDAGGRLQVVQVVRKGGREDRVTIPEIAYREIEALRRALRPDDQSPERPLAAMAVARWGNQSDIDVYEGLSPSHVRWIFRGLATAIAESTGESLEAVEARVHPHGLRHLYASTLAESGVPLHEIRDLLGHGSIATTDGYLSRSEASSKDYSDRLGSLAWPADDPDFAMNGRPAPRRSRKTRNGA